MEREHRYYVAKIKDVEKYLSDEHQLQFDRLLTKIRIGRLNDGKADVQTVCVDSDWPEYETVWRMIEARVDGKASPASAQEGWKHSCNALCVDGVELWIPQCPHCGKPAPTPPVSEDRKDAELLDYIQNHGATIQIVPMANRTFGFEVGGLHKSRKLSVREAIDAAMQEDKP